MNAKQKPPRRRALSWWGLLEAGSLLVCLGTITGFLARRWWIFELTSHFRPHLAVALTALAAIWATRRRWRLVAICSAGSVVNAFLVLLLLWPDGTKTSESSAQLRLTAINVHAANKRSDLVLEFLRRADADVILLMEVNKRWMNELSPLRAPYPHVVAEPREDDFGIALFSRISLLNARVMELGDAEVPSIAAKIQVGGQDVFLLGTHPLPPGSSEYARLRNDQLRQIAALVRNQPSPVVVIGDLNTTPWSPFFGDLLREGGLKNTSQGRGLFASWPAGLPLARIPLDHCLVSGAIQVMEKRLGPRVGADHLPVTVELLVTEN